VCCSKGKERKEWHSICSAKIVRASTIGFEPVSKRTSQLRIKECFYSRIIINVCAATENAVQKETEKF
jgi:hypothetical protein